MPDRKIVPCSRTYLSSSVTFAGAMSPGTWIGAGVFGHGRALSS